MHRQAIEQLINWKNKPKRKPMLIKGARQVGKTWLMREFGRQNYKNVAYISFNDNENAKLVFEKSYDVSDIISNLELISGTKINPAETLIILDEIQECDRALNALKFFKENAPEYNIVAAGSLLGVALKHKNISFPVGQVEFLELRPLSFYEFLCALGEDQLAELVQQANKFNQIEIMHEKLTQLLKHYLYVGGMPEVVAAYIENKDFHEVREIQNQILQGYQSDFSKYIDTRSVPRLQSVWDSIPHQLAKENKKFAYNIVAKGARAREYEEAIEWLILCGLVHRVNRISKPFLPLAGYTDSAAFKLFMLDCGLLCAKASLDVNTILSNSEIFTEYKGALTEQYVLQELKCINELPVAYWASESAIAELDFVFQFREQVIPMEVKATINLKARSLQSYREKYNQQLAVRTSLANYKTDGNLYDIPLYLIASLKQIIG